MGVSGSLRDARRCHSSMTAADVEDAVLQSPNKCLFRLCRVAIGARLRRLGTKAKGKTLRRHAEVDRGFHFYATEDGRLKITS